MGLWKEGIAAMILGKKGYLTGVGIMLLLLAAGSKQTDKADPLQPEIAEKVMRFHIMANSDTQVDQQLKEEVRDAVGELLAGKMEEAASKEECRLRIKEELPEIVRVSRETIEREGFDYAVTAEITNTDFPEKVYGPYVFPKGSYEALEIEIGNGEGHNWWCVLYPNMCFQNSIYEEVDQAEMRELKEVLTPMEYAHVFQPEKMKVRLKLLDFLSKSI